MFNSQRLARHLTIIGGLAVMALGAAIVSVPAAGAAGPAPAATVGTALLAPALTIRTVSPGGTEVHAETSSSEPTTFSYSVTPVVVTIIPPGRRPVLNLGDIVALPPGGGEISTGGTPPPPVYATKHNLRQTGLTPNTLYNLDVAGFTQSGVRLTAHAQFATYKQRVRITLDKILVTDDGDTFGSGEPTWFWQVGWTGGTLNDCYPQAGGRCQVGSATEGTVYPYTNAGKKFVLVFAQENFLPVPNPHPQPGEEDFTAMPQQFVLNTSAKESDGILGSLDAFFDWGAHLEGISQVEWTAPQGIELARQSLTISAEDGNFLSTMTFTFEVFYDNQVYTPNDGRVYSSSK